MTEIIGTYRDKPYPTPEGEKEKALNKHEEEKKELLRVTRELAIHIAKQKGTVCVDDLRDYLSPEVLESKDKRWFGVVFRDPRFKFKERGHSKVVANHNNIMNIYELR